MAEQPLISVIVPVYNVADNVGRCIESIVGQTYKRFELLLIDDGSTDGSAGICDAFGARDSRIRVFHQKNAGVSAARNVGLDNVHGEYITFIDADDFVPTFYLRRLLQGISGSALVMGSHVRVEGCSYSFKDTEEGFLAIPVSTCVEQLLAGRFVIRVWGGLFKVPVVGGLRFENGLRINEDKLFLYEYLLQCLDGNLSFSNQKLYAYCVRPGSASGIPWSGSMDYVLVADTMADLTKAVRPDWGDIATANAIAARLSTMKWILTSTDRHNQEASAALTCLQQEVLQMDVHGAGTLRQRVELAALRLGLRPYRLLVGAYYLLVSEAASERHNDAITRQRPQKQCEKGGRWNEAHPHHR